MGFAAPLLMAAGTAMGGWSSYQQGRYAQAEARSQAAMSQYNAQVADQNAKAAEAKTRFDQVRQQKWGQRMMGSLMAKAGASGAEVGEGAPLAMLADQASELALENMLIGVAGRTQAGQYESQATMERMQGKLYKQKGKTAYQAGLMNAGSTLLTGFGQMYGSGAFGGGGGYGVGSGGSGAFSGSLARASIR